MIKDRSPIGPTLANRATPKSALPMTGTRPAFLSHVVLNTRNVPAMVDWWCKVLQAHSMDQDYPAAAGEQASSKQQLDFITFDEEHHRLAFLDIDAMSGGPPTPGPALGTPTSLQHIAFTYASLGDLVKQWKYLKGVGILPTYTLHHGPTISNYYTDPDGNKAELQIDAFDSREELDAWFRNGDFSKHQGRGPTFDFERMAERYDAGDDVAWLKSNDGFITQYADVVRQVSPAGGK
jgi:catechol 2,3-dioxygenase-like lactoylglutathione lyase family enzyme